MATQNSPHSSDNYQSDLQVQVVSLGEFRIEISEEEALLALPEFSDSVDIRYQLI